MSRTPTALAVGLVLLVLQGCYGAKLVKGPINSEHAAVQADSIRADQRRILFELAELRRQLEEERGMRLRSDAQTGVTLSELEESIRILVSRFEDNAQRSSMMPPARNYTRPATVFEPDTSNAPPDTAGADSMVVDPVDPRAAAEEMYRAAYLDLTRGNYDLATQGFQSYLVRHATGAHVSEVHYYLGECYYARDRYLEAVSEFQYVVREFPASRLAPAAFLKSGYCYRELEERSLAEKAFRALIDQHPDTEEARQARTALDELEG